MAPPVQNIICFFSQSVSAVIVKCCIHFWEILPQMFDQIYKYFVQPMACIWWFDVIPQSSVEIHTCFRYSHPSFNSLWPNDFCMDQWTWSVLIQGAWLAPSHYLKQWVLIVTLRMNFNEGQMEIQYFHLTHWGLVTPFGNIDLGQHWLR